MVFKSSQEYQVLTLTWLRRICIGTWLFHSSEITPMRTRASVKWGRSSLKHLLQTLALMTERDIQMGNLEPQSHNCSFRLQQPDRASLFSLSVSSQMSLLCFFVKSSWWHRSYLPAVFYLALLFFICWCTLTAQRPWLLSTGRSVESLSPFVSHWNEQMADRVIRVSKLFMSLSVGSCEADAHVLWPSDDITLTAIVVSIRKSFFFPCGFEY